MIALVRTNFTSVSIFGNNTNSWGSPTFSSGSLTIARNPWNGRYQRVYLPVGFNYRYMLISLGGLLSGESFYILGGVWAGSSLVTLPAFRWGFTPTRLEPHSDVGPSHRGWASASIWVSPGRFSAPSGSPTSLRRPLAWGTS